MKLLYVASGHPLQEADDCLMWSKLGYEWYSTGYYAQQNGPGDLPIIPNYYADTNFRYLLENCSAVFTDNILRNKNKSFAGHVIPNLWMFTEDILKQFDVIFFNHFVDNIIKNFELLNSLSCKVVLKTYGMHPPTTESRIALLRRGGHLFSVRNSPKEHLRTPFFGGCVAVIRGSVVKDEEDVSGWTGDNEEVITFASNFNFGAPIAQRRRNLYLKIREGLPKYEFSLYGADNDNEPYSKHGFITHEEKLRRLRQARVSLITGTPYANNTYSMVESWIMGIPIVVFGRDMWLSDTYEANELVENGKTGFIAKTPDEAIAYIKLLMINKELAQQIGQAGREAAIQVYGREPLSQLWSKFFSQTVHVS